MKILFLDDERSRHEWADQHYNDNGHLLCDSCGEPFPYAEPAEHGGFVCTDCRITREMFE